VLKGEGELRWNADDPRSTWELPAGSMDLRFGEMKSGENKIRQKQIGVIYRGLSTFRRNNWWINIRYVTSDKNNTCQ
jgi:hypothetical protein